MPNFQFERQARTPYSEAFIIRSGEDDAGRVDIHYGSEVVTATLCLAENATEDDIQELIGEIDERLVMTAEPFRDDFVVTVWLGREAGVYSEDIDDETEGNGHQE
ncbi:MAG: hypothetical protein IIC88_07830 [Chloroflexi bacterium]|nr:hypothetical protein [Chloroflexota bacterium]